MFLLKQNEATAARRRVAVKLVDDADGKTNETGVTVSAGDLKVSKNGAAEANHAGTWAEIGGGLYYYEFTQSELDTLGFVTLRVVKSGVREFNGLFQVVAFDPWAASGLGLSNLDAAVSSRASQASADAIDDFLDTEIAAILSAVDTEVAAIKAKTDALPAAPAAQAKLDELHDNRLTAGRASNLDRLDATVSSRSTLSAGDIKAQVAEALAVDAYAEPAAVPPATASLKDKIGWVFAAARNKITQSTSQQKLRNDADSADLGAAAISDDGTTFTRDKFA